jgi:hypothetical protein
MAGTARVTGLEGRLRPSSAPDWASLGFLESNLGLGAGALGGRGGVRPAPVARGDPTAN